ncbi:TonB-dependent receptor domain-containing protein [Rufibacter sp. LB8]|uniref:TonB-dependent receptor domain-containing protein n=1 Tax=Rufibacter sp. LB8 TaxID=2777781 RepID=UPI00178C5CCF|nr:TonB-dependent receptor [Rufibacter sp. LB8]
MTFSFRFALFFLLFLIAGWQTKAAISVKNVAFQTSAGVPVTGQVMEATTKIPVGFATVALLDAAGKPVYGTAADANGQFTFPKVAAGAYQVSISFIGFATKLQPVTVSAAGALALGQIFLETDSKKLEEVVITGEKNLIQETDDGLVYNAENDITNLGGTATDVLKKVPMLSVDIDGNVEMRGSNKIKILINGKPSTMLSDNLAEALEQIPADLIQSVEVITSPSAKYEAEGSAGVVNIITKKSTLEGFTGSLNATAGNRSNNLNSNFNWRRRGLGLRASAGGNLNDRFGNSESDQIYFESRQISQRSNYENDGTSRYGQLSADYEVNEKNTLGGSLRLNGSNSQNARSLQSIETNPEGAITRQLHRDINTDGHSNNLEGNLFYRRTFARKNQEFEFLTTFNTNTNDSDYDLLEENGLGLITNRQENLNHSGTREMTFKADYTHPFEKYGQVEVGARSVLRSSETDYRFSSAPGLEAPLVQDPRRSNQFVYDQNVHAAYFSYTLRVDKKYILRVGGRYEYTTVHGNFKTTNTVLDKPFSNFMPNIMFRRTFKNDHQLRLSYSTRIQRPPIGQLNPYINDSNPFSIRYGNPDLEAELTHNTEINYSWLVKSLTFNASAYWRQTNNDIGSYQFVVIAEDTVQHNTFRNIGKNATYGSNLSMTLRFKQKGQWGVNGNVYYSDLNPGEGRPRRSGFMYNLNTNVSYRFTKELSVQAAASYNSARISLQSRSTGNQSYSLGVRKEFWNRKAGISLNMENFLQQAIEVRTTVQNPLWTSSSLNSNYNRVVRLTFNYRFGKMELKGQKELEKLTGPERPRNR